MSSLRSNTTVTNTATLRTYVTNSRFVGVAGCCDPTNWLAQQTITTPRITVTPQFQHLDVTAIEECADDEDGA